MRSNRICLMVLSLMVFVLSIDSYAGENEKSGNAPAGMVEIPGGTYYAGLGYYDMAGDVWEWMSSEYDNGGGFRCAM